MADVAPPVPPKLKPIIKHWASYAGPTASSSRSSSTSAEDDSASMPTVSHEIHTMRSSSSLPTRPPSPATLQNIKFAPLPHIEPRRRKSHVRLGVAARSRMIAARRGQIPPDWNEVEDAPVEEQRPTGPLVEDPFEVFGRYVLVKSKNLWRRVSPKTQPPTAVVVGEVHCDPTSTGDAPATDPEKVEEVSAVSAEPVQADEVRMSSHDAGAAGGVWEDEIGEQFQQHMAARVSSTTKKDKEAKKARRISLIRKESSTAEA